MSRQKEKILEEDLKEICMKTKNEYPEEDYPVITSEITNFFAQEFVKKLIKRKNLKSS